MATAEIKCKRKGDTPCPCPGFEPGVFKAEKCKNCAHKAKLHPGASTEVKEAEIQKTKVDPVTEGLVGDRRSSIVGSKSGQINKIDASAAVASGLVGDRAAVFNEELKKAEEAERRRIADEEAAARAAKVKADREALQKAEAEAAAAAKAEEEAAAAKQKAAAEAAVAEAAKAKAEEEAAAAKKREEEAAAAKKAEEEAAAAAAKKAEEEAAAAAKKKAEEEAAAAAKKKAEEEAAAAAKKKAEEEAAAAKKKADEAAAMAAKKKAEEEAAAAKKLAAVEAAARKKAEEAAAQKAAEEAAAAAEAERRANEPAGVGLYVEQTGKGPFVVKQVKTGGAAERDGRIVEGDIVLRIDNQSLSHVSSLRDLIVGKQGTTVVLSIQRASGETLDVTLTRSPVALS